MSENGSHANVLWLVKDTGSTHSRHITASGKSRFRASGSGVTSILSSADVSSKEWTLDDLPVDADPRPGSVLHPRVLGHSNEILGGLEISQTRLADSSRRCRSRFIDLVSACGSFTSERQRLKITQGSGRWLQFGRDPAFNPLSGLFSEEAQKLGEEEYYNMSAGSTDISLQGFPAAFFPRTVRGKQVFTIVFPVRFCSSATMSIDFA